MQTHVTHQGGQQQLEQQARYPPPPPPQIPQGPQAQPLPTHAHPHALAYAHNPQHYAPGPPPVHHAPPPNPVNPQTIALTAVPTSQVALDQQLRSKVISLLASTANGCIEEIGFNQLAHRLKATELQHFSLRASFDALRRENLRLIAEVDSCKNLQAQNQKLLQEYHKLGADFKTGSERHKTVCANYYELVNHYKAMRSEKERIQREKDTLQREVNILRNTRSLSSDQQYLLLEMKYNKVLEVLKTGSFEGSRQLDSAPLEHPMHSLYSVGPSVVPSQRRASEPVKPDMSHQQLPNHVLEPRLQRISTSVRPSQSLQSAPIPSRQSAPQATQLPSPVESSSSAGPSFVITPLSSLRHGHERRLSDSFVVTEQSRSTSTPNNPQAFPSGSNGPRSQSIPNQGHSDTRSHDVAGFFKWAPSGADLSTSRASPIPRTSSPPPMGSLQDIAQIVHAPAASSPTVFETRSNARSSGSPTPSVPDIATKEEIEDMEIDEELPAWSDPPVEPSEPPLPISSEAPGPDSATEAGPTEQPAYIQAEGSSSQSGSGEEWKSARESPMLDDVDLEPKPMIGDDGTLLVENGMPPPPPPPPQDQQMAEGANGNDNDEEEEEEDYSDLTDDEGPPGVKKARPIECVSEVFYDDASDMKDRHCQMCETRFQARLTDEEPATFTQSSLRDLITHLKTSHLVAWDGLRARTLQIKYELGE